MSDLLISDRNHKNGRAVDWQNWDHYLHGFVNHLIVNKDPTDYRRAFDSRFGSKGEG